MCIIGVKIFESLTSLPVSIIINYRVSACPCLAALLLLCCFEGCNSAVLAVSTKGRTRWQHHFLFNFFFQQRLRSHNSHSINGLPMVVSDIIYKIKVYIVISLASNNPNSQYNIYQLNSLSLSHSVSLSYSAPLSYSILRKSCCIIGLPDIIGCDHIIGCHTCLPLSTQ